MKILQITPAPNSAITVLANYIKKYNDRNDIEIDIFYLHPKRASPKEIKDFVKKWRWADVIDMQYWKSGVKAREIVGDEWNKKPKILSHHNPYDLKEENWEDYQEVVALNSYQYKELPRVTQLIWHCTDTEFFQFNENYTDNQVVQMAVGRIASQKGVEEVAQACKNLGYKFLLVGRISDPKYMEKVKNIGVEFRNDVSDQQLRQSYYEAAIHVCNSKDNYESGTLPILEAMACGTPVLTRKIGHVPDNFNGNNMRVMDCNNWEIDKITENLQLLMESKKARIMIRDSAREFIKQRDAKIWAKSYLDLYERYR